MCLGGGEAGAIQSYIMKMRANASKQTARQNKKGLPVDLVFNLTATHVNLWGACSYFKSTICTPSLSLLILET